MSRKALRHACPSKSEHRLRVGAVIAARRRPVTADVDEVGGDRLLDGLLAPVVEGEEGHRRGVEVELLRQPPHPARRRPARLPAGTLAGLHGRHYNPDTVRRPITFEVIAFFASRVDDTHRKVPVNMDPTAISERLNAALAADRVTAP